MLPDLHWSRWELIACINEELPQDIQPPDDQRCTPLPPRGVIWAGMTILVERRDNNCVEAKLLIAIGKNSNYLKIIL
jgi:hypothetical protein